MWRWLVWHQISGQEALDSFTQLSPYWYDIVWYRALHARALSTISLACLERVFLSIVDMVCHPPLAVRDPLFGLGHTDETHAYFWSSIKAQNLRAAA